MLLVGEAPSRLGDPSEPLSGRIGKRLADLSGLTLEEYLARTHRVNLLHEWPGSAGKGSSFNTNEAVWAASLLMIGRAKQHTKVLLLGKRVASAFGMKRPTYLEWSERHGVAYAVIPHPSGVNRWYNSAANLRKIRRFLTENLNGNR